MKVGANYSKNDCQFTVWAPNQDKVSLVLIAEDQPLQMEKLSKGYWKITVEGIKPESKYMYQLSKGKRADPASHFQPNGVFGPSIVVDQLSFKWKDENWQGIPLENAIIYELHVGAFTQAGSFLSASQRASELSTLGVSTIELMPVSQFTGTRNWGYDVAFPYAVQNTYGKPDDLKSLVQEFHLHGIAVILDVVYNHMGPEGNFLSDFGPYFLQNRKTPWGPGLNFDGPSSEQVRNYFLENALYWIQNFHLDGLRLDAVYAIIDNSPKHFLQELSEKLESLQLNRKPLLIAENDKIDPKMMAPRTKKGFGLDGIWNDNLHHSLHAVLTKEQNWYYSKFGTLEKIIEALRGDKRKYSLPEAIEPYRLIVFSQNHDQIGNRPKGERLSFLAGLEAAKLAAAIVVLSKNTPLIFMGEEYAETSPFLFFTDYTDPTLSRNVFKNRQKESFQNGWKNRPIDSQSRNAFKDSKLNWQFRSENAHKKILNYYQYLITFRKAVHENNRDKRITETYIKPKENLILTIQKQTTNSILVIIANFGPEETSYKFPLSGVFVKMLDSAQTQWAGPGSHLPNNLSSGEFLKVPSLSASVYVSTGGRRND